MRKSRQQLENIRRAAAFAAMKHPSSNNFTPEEAAELQSQMLGSVVLASTEGYDDLRQDFIHTYQSMPQLICFCEVPRDVQVSLKFADDHDLNPVCRSGGHSTAGYSVNDQMVIDLSRINYVVVDDESRTARVGAGANFAKLNAVLSPYGLHVPGGGCPSVCVAGYMQGGGYGFTSQMYGMNCDSVAECVVATADGKIIRASETSNTELFWALRGGTGNNFGVLLEITYQLYELGDLWGFGLSWPLGTDAQLDHASVVLETWQANFTGSNAQPDMGLEVFILDVEREENKPAKPELLIRGMHVGGEEACTAAIQPLLELCQDPAGRRDIWQGGDYESLNYYLMSYPSELPNVPMNVRAVIESRIVADPLRITDWRDLMDYFGNADAGALMIVIEPYGGAINEPAPEATAFMHRRARMDIFIWSFWMYEQDRDHAEDLVTQFRNLMQPLTNGHSYQNYPNRSTPEDVYPGQYWGGNYPRLQRVKAEYDPKSLFRFPQMVHLPGE
jgi:FAD/FMN-containing dehydrogenase